MKSTYKTKAREVIISHLKRHTEQRGISFLIRKIMTCCVADMSFVGFICGYPKAYELDDREWVEISGIFRKRFDDEMQRNIPVCRVMELKEIDRPEKEIISLI